MPVIRHHSRSLRIWHWLDGLTVIALISTFFLRESLVSHSRYFAQRLTEAGIVVGNDAAKPIIHDMVQDLWVWHVRFGYVLTALLLWRLVIFFTDRINPFRECWDLFSTARSNFDFRNVHSAVVRAGYILFYGVQIFMILSGFSMVFGQSLGIEKSISHLVHEAHETLMWFFVAFIVLHIVGVFTAENTGDAGITSAMINGGPVETKD